MFKTARKWQFLAVFVFRFLIKFLQFPNDWRNRFSQDKVSLSKEVWACTINAAVTGRRPKLCILHKTHSDHVVFFGIYDDLHDLYLDICLGKLKKACTSWASCPNSVGKSCGNWMLALQNLSILLDILDPPIFIWRCAAKRLAVIDTHVNRDITDKTRTSLTTNITRRDLRHKDSVQSAPRTCFTRET